jgi:hypothetical protein
LMGVWEVMKGVFSFMSKAVQVVLFPFVTPVKLIIQHWDLLKEKMLSVWDAIKPVFKGIRDAAMVFLQPVSTLIKGISEGVEWIGNKFNITQKVNVGVEKFKSGFDEGTKSFRDSQINKNSDAYQNSFVENFTKTQKAKGWSDELIGKYLNDHGYGTAQKKLNAEKTIASVEGLSGKSFSDKKIPQPDDSLASTSNGATSVEGKSQVRNVVVNITKLVEKIEINSTHLKESAGDITSKMEEYLLRAIQGAELASTNE